MNRIQIRRREQSGIVLLVGVIFLGIASVLAISSMRTTTTQERITSNHINKTQSLAAAEFGLTTALNYGKTWTTANTSGTLAGFLSAFNTNFGNGSWRDVTTVPQDIKTQYKVEIINDGGVNFIQATGIVTSPDATSPAILARTILRARFSVAPAPGTGLPPAPAAISCFGLQPCTLNPGASNNVVMSGRDHPLPPIDCSGNSCWTNPVNGGGHVPAVFATNRANLTLNSGNPANRRPFIDSDRTNPGNWTTGRVSSDNSIWDANNYSTENVPQKASYFDAVAHVNATNRAQFATFGVPTNPAITFMDPSTTFNFPGGNSNNAGILVIDGVNVNRNGTGTFRGLIFIRNCGKFSPGGNFNVYGAVLVDTTGCPSNYDPFDGNGTPSVRYSASAYSIGTGLLTGPTVFTANEWFEM